MIYANITAKYLFNRIYRNSRHRYRYVPLRLRFCLYLTDCSVILMITLMITVATLGKDGECGLHWLSLFGFSVLSLEKLFPSLVIFCLWFRPCSTVSLGSSSVSVLTYLVLSGTFVSSYWPYVIGGYAYLILNKGNWFTSKTQTMWTIINSTLFICARSYNDYICLKTNLTHLNHSHHYYCWYCCVWRWYLYLYWLYSRRLCYWSCP